MYSRSCTRAAVGRTLFRSFQDNVSSWLLGLQAITAFQAGMSAIKVDALATQVSA